MRRVRRCWRRCRSLESFVRRDWFGRPTGCRPTLLKFAVCDSGGGRCGKGGPGQAAALRLGGRRRAPTSLRCAVSWLRRGTHSVRYARSVQTTATSQTTMRAARAATSPVLLGASEASRRLPEPAFAEPWWWSTRRPRVVEIATGHRWWRSRQALPAGGDVWGDEKHSARVGARQRASLSDLPQLSERSDRRARSEFCGTTLARASQCSRPPRPTAPA